MKVADDRVLSALNEAVRKESTAATITSTLRRVIEQLNTSAKLMAWEVVPLNTFAGALPESIRSGWIFVTRPGAQTGAERHPNSHQRSFSLVGSGTFELRTGTTWQPHALNSMERASVKQRWVSIPPSTWHRLFAGSEPWGMLSFHTVAPGDLIEERPVDPNDLDDETRQERYTDRR